MTRTEKIKLAIDVGLLFFIISTVIKLLPYIANSIISGEGFIGAGVIMVGFVLTLSAVIVALLDAISIKLKKSSTSSYKSRILIIVGVLLITTGISTVILDIQTILIHTTSNNQGAVNFNLNASMYLRIIIDASQFLLGVCFVLIGIKKEKQIEDTGNHIKTIKLAIDVSLTYFIVTKVVHIMSTTIYLIIIDKGTSFANNILWVIYISTINSNLIPTITIIAILLVISIILRKMIHTKEKSPIYMTAGVLLIIDGLINAIITQAVIYLSKNNTPIVLLNISQVISYTVQIVIGICFIIMDVKRAKQKMYE